MPQTLRFREFIQALLFLESLQFPLNEVSKSKEACKM